MSTWRDLQWLAVDTETDSPRPDDAHIITAAAVYLGGRMDRVDHAWIAKPTRPIPDEAARIHGFDTERAEKEGSDPAEVLDLLAGEMCLAWNRGIPVVAFNAGFDCTVISTQLLAHGLPSLTDRLGDTPMIVLDPYVIDKELSWRKGSRKLVDQCAFYQVTIDSAHESTADAVAAARVLYRIGQCGTDTDLASRLGIPVKDHNGYGTVARMNPIQIHEWQIEKAMSQAKSLAAYFTKNGKHDEAASVGDGSWPIRSAP